MSKLLPIIELFTSIQGEGMFAGHPSVFVRTSGCNLRCCFKGSKCDTPYSSFNPEKPIYKTNDEVIAAIQNEFDTHPGVAHLVITGGEPLLHRDALNEVLAPFIGKKWITMETNGTQMPIEGVNLYSVSPKLSTSVGTVEDGLTLAQIKQHCAQRYNKETLTKLVYEHPVQLKFVYSGPECIDEIKTILKDLDLDGNYIALAPVILMPEGINDEQLAKSRKECVQFCIENGWTYSDRLHIVIWGDKRGV